MIRLIPWLLVLIGATIVVVSNEVPGNERASAISVGLILVAWGAYLIGRY